MCRTKSAAVLLAAIIAATSVAAARAAETPIKLGYCVNVMNLFAAPFAVIKKLGYDRDEGYDLQFVNIKSGGDCATLAATNQVPFVNAGVEPVAALVARGANLVTFYNHYQGTTLEIAVPENSPVKTIADLRGKKVGVRDFAGLGTIVGKGVVRAAGLDADKNVRFITVGPANVAARFLLDGTIDAISIGSSEHAQISITIGPKLRKLPTHAIDAAPAIGFVTSRDYYQSHKKEAEALARMYTKASIFATRNAIAAIEILYETWPYTIPQQKERAQSVKDDAAIMLSRLDIWTPEKSGRRYWGESLISEFDSYLKLLFEWKVLTREVKASEFVTNELIEAANKIDVAAIEKQADSYKTVTPH
jgi:NitT/TauT family transport system substrate-binding protein